MEISLSKKDIIWSYFAQFFSIASGLIVLPIILQMLSEEEIGMNYLMLTIGSLVSLFDFGFGPQFGRNITYVLSGAQKLKKEGIYETEESGNQINTRLLVNMIYTARFVYKRISLIVLVIMLSLGTLYIYKVTNGFINVHNSLSVWVVYSVSIFFNIYYTYYSSLLIGKGMIMESKKAMVYSKIVYLIINISLLFLGFGLISVAIANLLAPFVERYISHHYFFTKEFNYQMSQHIITKKEKLELFNIVWHNARKLGLVFIGAHAINRFSIFLAGLFFTLSEIASYGLMVQLVGILLSISSTLFMINNPRFIELNSKSKINELKKEFAFSMGIYYLLFIIGGFFLVMVVPELLLLIKSKAVLPGSGILVLYLIVMLLEGNHSFFGTMIVIRNSVPFLSSALISGGFIILGSYLCLTFTSYDLLGLILVQGIVQLAYNNWKWPYVVLKDYNIRLYDFLILVGSEIFYKIKTYYVR